MRLIVASVLMEFALFHCIRGPGWVEFFFNHRTHIKGLITVPSFPLLYLSILLSSFLSLYSKSVKELYLSSQGQPFGHVTNGNASACQLCKNVRHIYDHAASAKIVGAS